jgi:hypothetical protein
MVSGKILGMAQDLAEPTAIPRILRIFIPVPHTCSQRHSPATGVDKGSRDGSAPLAAWSKRSLCWWPGFAKELPVVSSLAAASDSQGHQR